MSMKFEQSKDEWRHAGWCHFR